MSKLLKKLFTNFWDKKKKKKIYSLGTKNKFLLKFKNQNSILPFVFNFKKTNKYNINGMVINRILHNYCSTKGLFKIRLFC